MTAAAGVDRQPPGARQALVLISAPLFAMLGALLVAPLLSTIEASYRGTPHADVLVPMLLTAPALFLALLSPVAGLVGERLGPRRLLLWSLGVYGLLGMAPIFLKSLYAILASRLLV
jgi:MFS family permease